MNKESSNMQHITRVTESFLNFEGFIICCKFCSLWLNKCFLIEKLLCPIGLAVNILCN